MKFKFHIQKYVLKVVFFVFTFFQFLNLNAQDKSAADTIDFIIKNKKSNDLVYNDLNALGSYYLDINEIDHAELVIGKLMKFSEENRYEKGIYDAYICQELLL